MAIIFPTHLFNPTNAKPTRLRRTMDGGSSLSGITEIINTDGGGVWRWAFTDIELNTPALLRAWDAWDMFMDDGRQEFWLPIPPDYATPETYNPTVGRLLTDDPIFPTVAAYGAPLVIASLTAPAALRATVVSLTVLQGARVGPGMRFAMPGPELHSIKQVISAVGQAAQVSIWPPVRVPQVAGAALNFDWPMMRARAVPGQDLSADVSYGRSATVSVTFEEIVS